MTGHHMQQQQNEWNCILLLQHATHGWEKVNALRGWLRAAGYHHFIVLYYNYEKYLKYFHHICAHAAYCCVHCKNDNTLLSCRRHHSHRQFK